MIWMELRIEKMIDLKLGELQYELQNMKAELNNVSDLEASLKGTKDERRNEKQNTKSRDKEAGH